MADERSQSEFAELVGIVCNQPAGPLRDAAMARLYPFVQQVAGRVCRQYGVGIETTRSFIDEINGELLLPQQKSGRSRLQDFDAAKGSFAGWIHTVVKRRLLDRFKRQRSQPFQSPMGAQDDTVDLLAQTVVSADRDVHSAHDWKQPFSGDDIKRVEAWLVRDRYVVLVGANLWHKVPRQSLAAWADEWGVTDSIPSAATLAAAEAEDRVRQLAAESGNDWPAFRLHWYRKRKRLLTLDFVRYQLDD